MILSSHGYTTTIPRRIEKFSRKIKTEMKWKCGSVGVRDVKDRDAGLRMEWNNDFTIAVAELKKQVEEY